MDGTFSAREDSPLRPSLGHKISVFQEKTRFSGMGVPPRRAAACTSGERGSDGACARSRENGAPNRPIWLQLLLLRAYGTIRPTILARFVAAAAAFAPPIPENLTQQVTFWWFLGGGISPVLATSGAQSLAPRELSPYGPLLEEKYFLTEQQCRREDRAQKSIRVNFFLRSAAFRGYSQLTRGQPPGDSCSTKSSSRRQV